MNEMSRDCAGVKGCSCGNSVVENTVETRERVTRKAKKAWPEGLLERNTAVRKMLKTHIVTCPSGSQVQQMVKREEKGSGKGICTGLQQGCYERVYVLFDVGCSL